MANIDEKVQIMKIVIMIGYQKLSNSFESCQNFIFRFWYSPGNLWCNKLWNLFDHCEISKTGVRLSDH